jgi:hypothetical protein
MPIARDFFQTFEMLPIADHPWVLREGLIFYLEHVRRVDPMDFLLSGIDIEELHSEILERLLASSRGQDNVDRIMLWRAYNELIYIFACCLNSIQNGPPSNAHIKLASRLTAHDTIITFNWDTLMDRALAEVTGWSIDAGYGVTPHVVFRNGWQPPATSQAPAPMLLKLHGSTNWLVGHPTEEKDGRVVLTQSTPASTLYAFEYAADPYDTYAGRFMPGFGPYSYGYYPPNISDKGRPVEKGKVLLRFRHKFPWKPEGTAHDKGLVAMPLIIPPVKNKSYDLFGELFVCLWARACEALTDATEIVIIGYSFPRTDHRSSRLFLDAFSRRSTIPRVTIVDPVPHRAVEKISFELGVPKERITVIAEPFSTEFDLEPILGNSGLEALSEN